MIPQKTLRNSLNTIESAIMIDLSISQAAKLNCLKSSSLPGSVVFETLQHLVELGKN